MSGENGGGSNQGQQQDAELRVAVRGRLNEITAGLNDTQRRLVLRTLDTDFEAANPDSLVTLNRFREIFVRCQDANRVERLHGDYVDHPDIVASVINIEYQQLQTALHRERQQRMREREQRMREVSRLLGLLFGGITVSGGQIGIIVETLMYQARDNEPLSFDSFERIVRQAAANVPALTTLRRLADQFIEIFNQNLPDSAEQLSRLNAAIDRRVAARGPTEVGPDSEASVSSLSDEIGLHISRDSSSSRNEDPPWLGRYFGGHGSPNGPV